MHVTSTVQTIQELSSFLRSHSEYKCVLPTSVVSFKADNIYVVAEARTKGVEGEAAYTVTSLYCEPRTVSLFLISGTPVFYFTQPVRVRQIFETYRFQISVQECNNTTRFPSCGLQFQVLAVALTIFHPPRPTDLVVTAQAIISVGL